MTTAFLFPGQGSQFVGMGKTAYDQFSEARTIFEQADAALGFSLSNICFEGPEDQLKLTYYTQPAILTTSIALLQLVQSRGIVCSLAAGHSLGEYSALVAAGALSFADAVRLVHARGRFMDEAVPAGQGAMSAVMGMERSELANVCAEASIGSEAVELANINCPSQIVISGTAAAVERAGKLAGERGARRVIPLVVSGPFHSSLMRPAADRLAQTLQNVAVADAKFPVVANVSAQPIRQAEAIKRFLVEQVYSSVLWEDSIRTMLAQGVNRFVEIGPGTVLAGLVKKIDRSVQVISIQEPNDIEKL
ncbi:ACP S-malonyltransferase [Fodinisporobacter ferrooxydans]|uniref:Malonyl CoA-acyl carrier protein transacylase n=1 Tax=Fodinisporobacter ferrooxydans TaxID=2901836 RepID=A0ABY4CGT6_9BACL|nr:ACP S-malonyltransferase [Alicyclobacillaceae bacterium MYW30-H2]